jgi:hypothetical protein
VPNQIGEKFNPLVMIEVAPLDWLKEVGEEAIPLVAFGAKGIATYQPGNFGTA